jgi:hypothetical protein
MNGCGMTTRTSSQKSFAAKLDVAFMASCMNADGTLLQDAVGGLGINFDPPRKELKSTVHYPLVAPFTQPWVTHSEHGGTQNVPGRGPSFNKVGIDVPYNIGGTSGSPSILHYGPFATQSNVISGVAQSEGGEQTNFVHFQEHSAIAFSTASNASPTCINDGIAL